MGHRENEGPQARVAAFDTNEFGQDINEDVLREGFGVVNATGPKITKYSGGNSAVDGAKSGGVAGQRG